MVDAETTERHTSTTKQKAKTTNLIGELFFIILDLFRCEAWHICDEYIEDVKSVVVSYRDVCLYI